MVEEPDRMFDEALDRAEELITQGAFDNAIHILVQLLAAAPGHPSVAFGLGAAIASKGDLAQAVPLLMAATQNGRNPRALLRLLATLWALKHHEELISVAENFQDLLGEDPRGLGYWATALAEVGRTAEAYTLFRRALEMAPQDHELLHNLSVTEVRLGRYEDAVATFGRKTIPWNGEVVAADVKNEYRELAPTYDQNTLHQAVSSRTYAFAERVIPNLRPSRVLDLGCGTGLLADHLPSSVRMLVGIDLSPDMLKVAARRGRYQELLLGDLVGVMAGLSGTFDAVFSSAVLCHIADLRPVFEQTARLLGSGGCFVFTVDPSPDGQHIGVTGPGEYCHSRQYIRALAADVGLSEVEISIDAHRASPGFYCAFQKRESR